MVKRMTITPGGKPQGIDWERVRGMSPGEIDADVAADPDAATLDEIEGKAVRVQMVRKSTGLSQIQFAERFRIPVGTVRDWEQGRREPDAAALAYLQVIQHDPEAVTRALAPHAA